jgi:hypothetical protein
MRILQGVAPVHPSRCCVWAVVVLFGEKRLPPFPSFFLHEGSFWMLLFMRESSFRISPPLLGCRSLPLGGNLLLSEATLVRVVFEKTSPPS